MAERISQDEFNEMVNDNMREYQLSREKSCQEVVEHLRSEGVDLSDIFIATTEDDYEAANKFSAAFTTILKASERTETLVNAMFAMQTIRTTCQSSKLGAMAKSWFGLREGVILLSRLLKSSDESDADEEEEDDKTTEYVATFRTICSVCQSHTGNISYVSEEFFENVILCIQDNIFEAEIVKSSLEVWKILVGPDFSSNKIQFIQCKGLEMLETASRAHGNDEALQTSVIQILQMLMERMPEETKNATVQTLGLTFAGIFKKLYEVDMESALIMQLCLLFKALNLQDEALSSVCISKKVPFEILNEKLLSLVI